MRRGARQSEGRERAESSERILCRFAVNLHPYSLRRGGGGRGEARLVRTRGPESARARALAETSS
jgi:hypothetical protein